MWAVLRNCSSEIGVSFSMGAVYGYDVFLCSSGETGIGRRDVSDAIALVSSLALACFFPWFPCWSFPVFSFGDLRWICFCRVLQ